MTGKIVEVVSTTLKPVIMELASRVIELVELSLFCIKEVASAKEQQIVYLETIVCEFMSQLRGFLEDGPHSHELQAHGFTFSDMIDTVIAVIETAKTGYIVAEA